MRIRHEAVELGPFLFRPADADVHVFAVTPAQVLAFRKGAFSQTSHRF